MIYNVLVVEDQPDISSIVSKYLEKEGYVPFVAGDGFEALDIFNNNQIHLALLDVMMPGIDGFEVLAEIRKMSQIPVIMLTAKIEEIDRLKGFDIGADDYVLKPFSVKELIKRVQVLLKRVYNNTDEIVYHCEGLSLHLKSMKLYKGNVEIPVTSAEFGLLSVFFRYQGQVLTREQLIEAAYGYDYSGYDRNIDSYIKRIRQKIESDPKNPKLLFNKIRSGLCFGRDRELTIRKQWLVVLTLTAVIAVSINSFLLSALINRYFQSYTMENYNIHVSQIQELARNALVEGSFSPKQLSMQFESHLDDPILSIKLYDADGPFDCRRGKQVSIQTRYDEQQDERNDKCNARRG